MTRPHLYACALFLTIAGASIQGCRQNSVPLDHSIVERDGMLFIKGGRFIMGAENFCSNYRVAARSHATPDSGMNNLGFRCVRDE